MEKLGLNQIRSMFREFYVSKGHYPEKSASLVPKDDNSLLIINSGMAPLKPYFAGVKKPPKERMTTCQKCIRTGDIENVGKTARHGTFFEMLGNFSFGDYFKEQSLTWGWEFITKWLKLPEEKVWATVYQDDDEAVEIWKKIGMPAERIVRLGKEDNFWEIGLGPCGPCSEIYFDRGEEYGCGKPDCKPGCDCDRYIEFWNHVFTQYSKQEDGSYADLEHKNIDTGMGLERMACIMQGVCSIFDIDTIRHILDGVLELTDKKYEEGDAQADISIRIITDHIRSIVFMIADGILPSNEGRGYVLRRIIRRAARHGKLLGIEGNFLTGLVDKVIEVSGEAYPEIDEKQDYIKKIISIEEERFTTTLEQGCNRIQGYIDEIIKFGETVLPGDKAFKLYDTYGFPIELTQEILEENGLTADLDGFKENMKRQQEQARSGKKDVEGEAWKKNTLPELPDTEFIGYEDLECMSTVLAIYKDGDAVDSVSDGETAIVYLDQTPFYAESGGQVSDNGYMATNDFNCKVISLTKQDKLVAHEIKVGKGTLKNGTKVLCNVNIFKRNSTARNHTATHLLQKALQEVLGDHVTQAGSKNDEKVLRFDFTHFEAMTPEQIERVEYIVNQKIVEFLPVETKVLPIEEAKNMGAMALFGEKYGDFVRVVNCGDWSIEFCGGTHVSNTGQIGAFKIISESGISSGVRRIEAVTGMGVLLKSIKAEEQLAQAASALKVSSDNVASRAASVMTELKDVKKSLEDIKKAEMMSGLDDMVKEATDIEGVKLITKKFENAAVDDLRNLCDDIKKLGISSVMVFATVNEGKVVLLVSVTDDLLAKGFHSGGIVKELAKSVGGGGGGKADMAQAGGKNPAGIPWAFDLAERMLIDKLENKEEE